MSKPLDYLNDREKIKKEVEEDLIKGAIKHVSILNGFAQSCTPHQPKFKQGGLLSTIKSSSISYPNGFQVEGGEFILNK